VNQSRPDISWETLLDAARPAGKAEATVPAAPEEFVDRMRKLRAGLWEFARLLLWRRSAVFFALAAAALYLGFYFTLREPPGPSIPLPAVPNLTPP